MIKNNGNVIKYTSKTLKNKLNKHDVSRKKRSTNKSSSITKNKKGGNIEKKNRMNNTNHSIQIIPASSLF